LPGCGPSGPTLEIFEYSELVSGPVPAVNRPGLAHLAFSVRSVSDARTEVLARGGSAVGGVVSTSISTGELVTWCYVRDPEGNIIELQSWAPGSRA
jgi:predicted enzyme related to lactoylglutathione lyase